MALVESSRSFVNSIFLAALALVVSGGCADDIDVIVQPVTGKVVDSHLNPVPGALIAVTYEGTIDAWSEASSRCVRATTVQADEHGNFRVPGWSKRYVRLRNLFASLVPYKPGFEDVGGNPVVKGNGLRTSLFGRTVLQMGADNVVLQLKPFSGLGAEDRRKLLVRLISATSCSDPDVRGMRSLYEAIYREAKVMPPEDPVPGHATLLQVAAEMARNASGNAEGGVAPASR